MITYIVSQVHHFLRETLAPATAPQACPEQGRRVTVSRTCYVVPLNGTIHRVRRDRACDCSGTAQRPCPAVPLVQDFLVAGGERPLGRHPDTWPESWNRVPPLCPICDSLAVPDRYLNSRAGPGWRCSLTGCWHFWQVRMEPLRRYLKANPPEPCP